MAGVQDVFVSGEALNSFGFIGENTISGIGLMTFGFIWNCGAIWVPTDDPGLATVWVPSTFGMSGQFGCYTG